MWLGLLFAVPLLGALSCQPWTIEGARDRTESLIEKHLHVGSGFGFLSGMVMAGLSGCSRTG